MCLEVCLSTSLPGGERVCLEVCKSCLNAVAATHTFNTQLNIYNPNLTLHLYVWLPCGHCPQSLTGTPSLLHSSSCLWDPHLGPRYCPLPSQLQPETLEQLNPSHSLTPPPHLPSASLALKAPVQPTPLLPPACGPGTLTPNPAPQPGLQMPPLPSLNLHLAARSIFLKCKSELVGPDLKGPERLHLNFLCDKVQCTELFEVWSCLLLQLPSDTHLQTGLEAPSFMSSDLNTFLN